LKPIKAPALSGWLNFWDGQTDKPCLPYLSGTLRRRPVFLRLSVFFEFSPKGFFSSQSGGIGLVHSGLSPHQPLARTPSSCPFSPRGIFPLLLMVFLSLICMVIFSRGAFLRSSKISLSGGPLVFSRRNFCVCRAAAFSCGAAPVFPEGFDFSFHLNDYFSSCSSAFLPGKKYSLFRYSIQGPTL